MVSKRPIAPLIPNNRMRVFEVELLLADHAHSHPRRYGRLCLATCLSAGGISCILKTNLPKS